MIYLIKIILILALLIFSWVTLGRKSISILIPLLWFIFWFLIANLNPLGLYYEPKFTFLFIYLCIIFFILGAISKSKSVLIIEPHYLEREREKSKRLSWYLVLLSGPSIIFLSIKAIALINSMPLYSYRRTIYSEPELLMGIKELFPLFQLFIEGGILLLLLMAFQRLFLYNEKRFILISFFFACVFSIIFLGRYSLYRIIVLALIFTFSYSENYKSIIKSLFISSFIAVILIGFSIFRSDGLFGVEQVLIKHIIGYHSFGFSLFESYYVNAPSFTERTWGGGALFGSFFYFILKPIDIVFNITTYLQSIDYYSQDDFLLLGVYSSGDITLELEANAFYTVFTDLYRDLSWFGVIVFFPLGVFSSYLKLRLSQKDPVALLGLMYVAFLIVFMTMKNPFVRHEIVLPTFYVLYKIFITRKFFRYV